MSGGCAPRHEFSRLEVGPTSVAAMKQRILAVAVLGLAATTFAQERQPESAAAVAERIRNGGWFETSRWRRGADGALEMHFFADVGAEVAEDRFVPLLSKNGEELDYDNIGLIGNLALFCHGPGDLLGMTDAEFHLHALGIGTTDVELRQYLAVPPPPFEGERGRAELLDRLLAANFSTKGSAAFATVEIKGFTPAKVKAIAEVLPGIVN